jgi:hypothetical protein
VRDGSLESGGRFYVGAFGRNVVTVTAKTFSRVFIFRNVINFVLSMRFAKIMLQ